MSEDWFGDDPDATERERRWREREERRHSAAPTAPPPAEPPPEPSGGPPSKPRRSRRRIALAGVAVVVLLLAALAAAAVYRHSRRSDAPPPVVLKTVTVTIPEGYSREQTAQIAKEAGLTGSYMKASKGHEGFLFPDTFELEKGAPASDLVELQLQDFKRRVAGVDMRYARSKNLTTRDVVTIASMIEREAQLEKERPLIAAVIYNRLHDGMPLGIDATIRFATGNYDRPLTESELAVDSPYNTRLNAGLPPGPIGSPGLASIEAAAHPAKVDYLFYVVKPGACGEHSFSASEAQFEADVARYDEAREAAGGESPDTCGE
ncbi:MAG TPA: endolytic transglycosylase MltG [Solirubrobacterales bacterium]|nr:endolytic transglycosylase MltG [Solirubrobacterales bacterium]